jgi:hypothetical protein
MDNSNYLWDNSQFYASNPIKIPNIQAKNSRERKKINDFLQNNMRKAGI